MAKEQQVIRCRRCNRIIKNPKYKHLGYGKSCLTKLGYMKQKELIQLEQIKKDTN